MTASLVKEETKRTVSVLLSVPPSRPYDYVVPQGLKVSPGDLVDVPLGTRRVLGVVWGPGSGGLPPMKIKPLLSRRPLDGLSEDLRSLIDWVGGYYLASSGAVLRMALSTPSALQERNRVKGYRDSGSRPERITPQRARVFELLSKGVPRELGDIVHGAGVSPGVVKQLENEGHLLVSHIQLQREQGTPNPDHGRPQLSRDQQCAADSLRRAVMDSAFGVKLLDGVTGAGKTEVYFEAIAESIEKGDQTLILIPEIALTEDLIRRFHSRFGIRPWAWHSEIGAPTRRETWRQANSSRPGVFVGTRSSLFLPFQNLGLIVVDEEHDPSYKQEEGVAYNARDVAIMRGRFASCPVVLVSATPSLETHRNANLRRYERISLPRRFGRSSLPSVEAIDMRVDRPASGRWISPKLDTALRETMRAGSQTLLFLNRRGYAPLTLCGACGFRIECKSCSAWLVEHREHSLLTCHHCGYEEIRPTSCPRCAVVGRMVACGPGVERLAEEVGKFIPEARVRLMTSDTIKTAGEAKALVQDMLDSNIDILVGTQMVTKGFHFPSLTLVGVIDADLGLSGGNLRAGERSMQLLSQVSGRAGRAEKPGRAILQTYLPEHPIMAALIQGDRETFIEEELEARREAGMPPFSRLAGLIVSSASQQLAFEVARLLVRKAPVEDGLEIFGPAPAPISLLRGKYRFRLLVRTPRKFGLQALLRSWLGSVEWSKGVSVKVDVDPYTFM
ncbi:MAG: primosomal protein N' [Pseudomonadota bacterium]|nr:primosomal protein N' [Pseudomonadota bacterium]